MRIWLVPDGPDEATAAAIAEQIADPRIVILSCNEHVGVLRNVERGVEAALAEAGADDLFAFADQDDVWHRDKLAKGVAALPDAPIAMSTHDARIIDSEGRVAAPSVNAYEERHPYLDQLALLIANSVSGMSVVATREAIARALPFPEAPELLHDWWLTLLVSGLGTIARIDEPLVDYRQHGGNVIGAKQPGVLPLLTLSPIRPFLGRSYRQMAREAFAGRRDIAIHLQARGALAPPAAAFFIHRRIGGLLVRWRGNQRRYAIRCAIGMLLS